MASLLSKGTPRSSVKDGASSQLSLSSRTPSKSTRRTKPSRLRKTPKPATAAQSVVPTGSAAEAKCLNAVGQQLTETNFLQFQPKVEAVFLRDNMLKDLSHMGYLPNLVVLDVSMNELQSLAVQPSFDSPYLRQLYLDRNLLTGGSLRDLPGHRTIEVLSLSQNNIEHIRAAPPCPELKTLFLSRNNIKSLEGLDKFAPNLEVLSLDHNPVFDDENYYDDALNTWPNLRKLDGVDLAEVAEAEREQAQAQGEAVGPGQQSPAESVPEPDATEAAVEPTPDPIPESENQHKPEPAATLDVNALQGAPSAQSLYFTPRSSMAEEVVVKGDGGEKDV